MRRRTGKPANNSILDDRFILEFANYVQLTGSIETAILKTGIGRETYFGWMRDVKGDAGNRKMLKLKRRLYDAVESAKGEVKFQLEASMRLHAQNHWQANAWALQRRFPEEYGDVVFERSKQSAMAREAEEARAQVIDIRKGAQEIAHNPTLRQLHEQLLQRVEEQSCANGDSSDREGAEPVDTGAASEADLVGSR